MARGKHSPFTDSMGRFMTRSLFVETIQKEQLNRGIVPVYTLKGDPRYIDIHDMYMDKNDPTEYSFAIEAFASWQHFQYMCTLMWFQTYINPWREELEISMRSKAFIALMDTATGAGSRGVSAAKYIASSGWKSKRGRPTKADREKEKRLSKLLNEELSEDAARLGYH